MGLSRNHIQGMLREGTLEGLQDEEGRWWVPANTVHERLPDHPLKAEEALRKAWEPEEWGRTPAPEEFREAKRRELARLNVRLSSVLGKEAHTPEDIKALSRETPELEARDRETVRRWCAAQKRG